MGDSTVCLLQLVVCAIKFSRIEDSDGAAPEEFGAACSLCSSQGVKSDDELVIQLHEDFLAGHYHMVNNMVRSHRAIAQLSQFGSRPSAGEVSIG